MRMLSLKGNFFVTLSMYLFKVIIKGIGGFLAGSMSMVTDAIHNIIDILQLLLLNFGIYLSRKENSEKYPLGSSPLQNVVSIAVSVSLILLALGFVKKSASRLLGIFYPDFASQSNIVSNLLGSPEQIADVEVAMLWLPILIFALSVVVSYFVAKFELKVAELERADALEADAKELLMDMQVEMGAGIIFLLMFILHWLGSYFNVSEAMTQQSLNFADASLNVFIAYIAIHTGIEIFVENTESLLNKAISQRDQQKIMESVQNISGVDKLAKPLQAFHRGADVYVLGTINVKKGMKSGGIRVIKTVAENRTRSLLESKYSNVKVHYAINLSPVDFDEMNLQYKLRIPDQTGHPFRSKVATHSDSNRPPIPEQNGHLFRQNRPPVPAKPATLKSS